MRIFGPMGMPRIDNECSFVQSNVLCSRLLSFRCSDERNMTRHLQRLTAAPACVRRSKRQRTSIAPHPSLSYSSGSSEEVDSDAADSDFDPTSQTADLNDDDQAMPSSPAVTRKLRPSGKRKRNFKEAHTNISRMNAPHHAFRISFAQNELAVLRSKLLDWYVDNHRKLPWRASPRYQKDGLPSLPLSLPESQSSPGAPYAVWISEVMSQQTRIQVVVEYYNRWIREFPTIHHLSESSLERVNELWAGLGYYRRARFLHEGAKQIIDKHSGNLPPDVTSLRKLKGIGRYTAGAISSISFGHAEPVVDGNVERVLSRLLPALTENQDTSKGLSERYWSIASKCVQDVSSPGDFNQAMMELGATVCKPKNVDCSRCPLQSICGAYKAAIELGIEDPSEYVTRYPIKDSRKQKKVREESVMVLVVCAYVNGLENFLLLQRPKEGLLASLWEAPNRVIHPDRPIDNVAVLEELLQKLRELPGVNDDKLIKRDRCVEVRKVLHVFSHIRQTLDVRLLELTKASFTNVKQGTTSFAVPFRWVSRKDMEDSALSTQMRRVFVSAFGRLDHSDKS